MSGGYFDYKDTELSNIVDALNNVLDYTKLGVKNEWGEFYRINNIDSDIAEFMTYTTVLASKLSRMLHDIDWYLSGDTSEDAIRNSDEYKRYFGKKEQSNVK